MITEGELSDQRSAFSDISKLTDHVSVHCNLLFSGHLTGWPENVRFLATVPDLVSFRLLFTQITQIQNLKWPPRVI